jgi:hypothetical protein
MSFRPPEKFRVVRMKRISVRRIPGTSRLESSVLNISRVWHAHKTLIENATVLIGAQQSSRRLQALQELQRRLDLTPAKATQWQDAVREARR